MIEGMDICQRTHFVLWRSENQLALGGNSLPNNRQCVVERLHRLADIHWENESAKRVDSWVIRSDSVEVFIEMYMDTIAVFDRSQD